MNLSLHAKTAAERRQGFTIIELVVTIGIVGLLAALLLPALATARSQARVAQCMNNLRQIGAAISVYADDYRGVIPSATPMATNKVWDNATGTPDSLGLLVTGRYLLDVGVLFCPLQPENDIRRDGSRIGLPAGAAGGDVYASFIYRQHSVGSGPFHLENLGRNPAGRAMRALALDSSCPPWPRIAHMNRSVNILFHDGSVSTRDNRRHDFSVMSIAYAPPNAQGLPPVVGEIFKIFINADAEYGK